MAISKEIRQEDSQIPKNILIRALRGSIKAVYNQIMKRPMRVSEIQEATNYSNRTVRNALKKLNQANLIKSYVDMSDLRSKLYKAI